eukprot:TRINITY_DN10483_c0_g1_i1.p1 TRINITY_DN10483_c0_g1~~TRINITY_DN10483_c0_g1_i1.p1  ORF type:complete len:167 (-),score=35.75 TRINITY_DN10483_c0_g1_i1:95-595(-)
MCIRDRVSTQSTWEMGPRIGCGAAQVSSSGILLFGGSKDLKEPGDQTYWHSISDSTLTLLPTKLSAPSDFCKSKPISLGKVVNLIKGSIFFSSLVIVSGSSLEQFDIESKTWGTPLKDIIWTSMDQSSSSFTSFKKKKKKKKKKEKKVERQRRAHLEFFYLVAAKI